MSGLLQRYRFFQNRLICRYPLLRFIPGPLKNGWDAVRYTTEQEWNLFEKELVRHEETYSEDQVRDLFDAYIRHVRGNDDFDPQAMQSRCTDGKVQRLLGYRFGFLDKDDLITTSSALWGAGPTATNVALLWALLFLCLHPDVQEKVHEEIDRVVGKDRPITSADRSKSWKGKQPFLEFLDAVTKYPSESVDTDMRLLRKKD